MAFGRFLVSQIAVYSLPLVGVGDSEAIPGEMGKDVPSLKI
jgi:hypothetical protein